MPIRWTCSTSIPQAPSCCTTTPPPFLGRTPNASHHPFGVDVPFSFDFSDPNPRQRMTVEVLQTPTHSSVHGHFDPSIAACSASSRYRKSALEGFEDRCRDAMAGFKKVFRFKGVWDTE